MTHPAFVERGGTSLHAYMTDLLSYARAKTTNETYRSRFRQFIVFIAAFGFITTASGPDPSSADGTTFPKESYIVDAAFDPVVLCYFVTSLYRANYGYDYIRGIVTAVRTWCRDRSRPDPTVDPASGDTHTTLCALYRAIKRIQTRHRKRFPVTSMMMQRLQEAIFCQFYLPRKLAVNLWAACCLAWFALARVGEFTVKPGEKFDAATHACRRDVQFVRGAAGEILYATFCFRASKTGPFRVSFTARIYPARSDLCAVSALETLFTEFPAGPDEPLFDFSGDCSAPEGPSSTADGRGPDRAAFCALVHAMLLAAGVDDSHVSSHSFRQGGASALAAAGAPSWLIRSMGRWRSDCWTRYVSAPESTVCQAAADMARAPRVPGVQTDWICPM